MSDAGHSIIPILVLLLSGKYPRYWSGIYSQEPLCFAASVSVRITSGYKGQPFIRFSDTLVTEQINSIRAYQETLWAIELAEDSMIEIGTPVPEYGQCN
ncbi:MAG: hypothetical protein V3U65_14085 [Granulosicoccaceae bacterium]